MFPRLSKFSSNALNDKKLNLVNFDKCRQIVRKYIQDRAGGRQRRLNRLNDKIITGMQNFKNLYPEKTNEQDAAIESLEEFDEIFV